MRGKTLTAKHISDALKILESTPPQHYYIPCTLEEYNSLKAIYGDYIGELKLIAPPSYNGQREEVVE